MEQNNDSQLNNFIDRVEKLIHDLEHNNLDPILPLGEIQRLYWILDPKHEKYPLIKKWYKRYIREF